jgi:hypothetical protein
MYSSNRLSRVLWSILALIPFLCISATSHAAEPPGPQVRAAEAAKKLGAFQLKLTERSPLSKMSDVAARMGITARFDYQLPQEVFTAYVPKTPGPDGKYGLMVSLHFREYGWPAPAWTDILEKYHIVWIGPQNSEDGRAINQRIGLVLDATFNAKKLWPIDDRRTYACISTPKSPESSFALQYADIYQGALHSIGWRWDEPLPSSKQKGAIWKSELFKKPDLANWDLAKRRGRYFLAARVEPDHPANMDVNQDILNEGYLKSGFKYVKLVPVPQANMDHYFYYTADWFEEGIKFLDAPLSDPDFGKSTPAKAAAPTAAASATPQSLSTRPATASLAPAPTVDEKAAAAEKALSLAKSYVAAQNYTGARSRLEKLVQSYPNTRAAKEAQDILKDIAGK